MKAATDWRQSARDYGVPGFVVLIWVYSIIALPIDVPAAIRLALVLSAAAMLMQAMSAWGQGKATRQAVAGAGISSISFMAIGLIGLGGFTALHWDLLQMLLVFTALGGLVVMGRERKAEG